MLELSAPDFSLMIEPLSRRTEGSGSAYFDWIDCTVRLNVPGFHAEIAWMCMPDELDHFKRELQEIDTNLVQGSKATLRGVEKNFALGVRLVDAGGLIGHYQLQNDSLDGPILSGEFGIDQSYLPQMIRELNHLIQFQHST